MVVRIEVLRERIALLRETVERLRGLAAQGVASPIDEWAAERGLQIAAQSLFDIGNHVLSGGFGERPAEYAAVPGMLTAHGVINAALEARLQGLAGFRNLLVHDYVRVDPARVREFLVERLGDFEAFASAVEVWFETDD